MYLWLLRMGINHTSHFGDITLPVAASDYGLYWFDYKAGYDTMFAEFGWNYSRAINVGLVRGAATVQDKEWGVSGAKYVIVFDSNDNWTDGILLPEHFEAMQKFWNYVQANPQAESSSMDRVAYVLPDEYAYGFRGHNEKIWGLFPLDDFTRTLYEGLTNAIDQFGDQLDIIYNDPAFPNYTSLYGQLVFWNGTVITQ
jgi:hypothetical protein